MKKKPSAIDLVHFFIGGINDAQFLWGEIQARTPPGQTPIKNNAIDRQCAEHLAAATLALVRLELIGLPKNLFDAGTKVIAQWGCGDKEYSFQEDVWTTLLKWAENPVKENNIVVGSDIRLASEHVGSDEEKADKECHSRQDEADQKAPLYELVMEFCRVMDGIVGLSIDPAREADARGMTMETFETVAGQIGSKNIFRAWKILQTLHQRGMPDVLARLCDAAILQPNEATIDRVLWAEVKPRLVRWGTESNNSSEPQWILISVLAKRMQTDKSGLLKVIKEVGCTTRPARFQKNAKEVLAAEVGKLQGRSDYWNERVELFNAQNTKTKQA